NLDGNGEYKIYTGVGFFDHMLELFACHGSFDLELTCKGDLQVDGHHSVEDIGIVLGKAIAETTINKVGIARYSAVTIPMDEALATVTIDLSGRPFLVFNADLEGKTGDFDNELVEEFFRALCNYGGIT
ncbi:MAG: imidazoleglycerol-phosphate dehydratase, partial [Clostridia bacterium]